MEIKKSLSCGWKKLLESWWWLTLIIFYVQIGNLLFFLFGFAASKFTGNHVFLDRFSNSAFKLFLSPPPNYRNLINYSIATFFAFLMLYFFAGFLPSGFAENKNHNKLIAKTAFWFFVLNVGIMFSALAVSGSLNSALPNSFSNLTTTYEFLVQFASAFGANLFIIIALLSYIYKNFSVRNAVQVSVIYIAFILLTFIVQKILLGSPLSAQGSGSNAHPPAMPYIAWITAVIFAVVYVIQIFLIPETVLQGDFKKGIQRGFYLFAKEWRILILYIVIYLLIYGATLLFMPFVMRNPAGFMHKLPVFIDQWLFGMFNVFIMLSMFALAYFFENKDAVQENSENSDDL